MIPSYLLPGIPGFVYYLYYKTYCRKIPEIFAGEGPFIQLLRQNCPILQEEYHPTPLIHESRLMTIFSSLTRHRGLNYPFLREIFVCSDGGEVALDWWNPKATQLQVEKNVIPVVFLSHIETTSALHSEVAVGVLQRNLLTAEDVENSLVVLPDTTGIVLILPGLTGDSTRNYVKGLVQVVEGLGLTAVVMNYRGQTGSLKTPKSYCAADTSDLAAVVEHIKERYPTVPLLGIGVSLGGILLTNYLAACGRENTDSKLIGGFAVSAPWNCAESCKVLEEPLNWLLFNRMLANNLCEAATRHSDMLKTGPCDLEELKNVRTIKDFDEKFTAKMFGYSGVDEYYSSASLYNKVHQIKTPLLALNAADDVFSPYDSIPKEAENPNVCIVVTSHGGHIGFMEGWNPFGTNYVERMFAQFAKTMLANHKYSQESVIQDAALQLNV